ncbi:MAG: flagellar protein FlaG [Actinobacteria bacterium]|jgi:flagellar protein FlaG|nr:flagellar protein FlaG [Actinomycetota bacterium]NCV42846.1 flagellar protein FlaG [Actinomycetota bacterium]NCW93196.1 flagellar protein FlaG [Actinomycetota bacterium]
MSSPVNAYLNSGSNVNFSDNVGSFVGSSVARVKTDAEVIAQVASVQIKPSNINEVLAPTREAIEKIAADLQKFVQSMGRDLSFSVDQTTGYHVVRVINPSTGELVRQLPSDELLKIARDFERLHNALVSLRA